MKAKVHPQVEQVLQALAKANLAPFETLTPDQARAQMEAMVKARNVPLPPLGGIENRRIPGPHGEIPIRIYRPIKPQTSGAVLYFHGGGHVIGSLDTHEAVASATAMRGWKPPVARRAGLQSVPWLVIQCALRNDGLEAQ